MENNFMKITNSILSPRDDLNLAWLVIGVRIRQSNISSFVIAEQIL